MAKHNEFMHFRDAIKNLAYSDGSLYHKNFIPMKKISNSQLTYGLQNFENFIYGSRLYHQKKRN